MAPAKKRAAAKPAQPMLPRPPRAYMEFTARFPDLAEAWDLIHRGGEAAGPLDAKTQRLIKLAVAISARQEGAVRSGARKGLAMGLTVEEMEQVVALAAGTLGLPASVAAYTWIHEVIDKA